MKFNEDPSLLAQLLEPVSRSLNPSSAKALAKITANPKVQSRVSELAVKANEGTLSPAERREYETAIHASNIIAILQANARLYLKQKSAT